MLDNFCMTKNIERDIVLVVFAESSIKLDSGRIFSKKRRKR
jgi:hypothetical protein